MLSGHWILPYHGIYTYLLLDPWLQVLQFLLQAFSLDRVPQSCRMCGTHPLETVRRILDSAVIDDVAHLWRNELKRARASYHGSCTRRNLELSSGPIIPLNSDVGTFRCADCEKTTDSRRRNGIESAVEVPLEESGLTSFALLCWNVRRKVEVMVAVENSLVISKTLRNMSCKI